MRQKLISVCIVAIIVFSIYGCTQTAEDTLAVPKVCTGKLGAGSTKSAEQEEQPADATVPQEEPEPEKEIDFDGSDIHLSILTEYERAWEDETYTVEQWQDVAGVFMTLTDAKWLGWSAGNYTLYYSISDLSGDGTEELIIGIRGEDGIAPCFLYTGDGEKIHMTDSRTGSDLVGQPSILYEKGIVESREYIKYGMYRYNFYQLPKDAGEMELIDCYFYFYIEDLENGTQYYRGDMDNTIEEEKFWNGIKDYESKPQIELDWHELDGFWESDEDGAKTTVIGEEYRQSGQVAESEGKAESKEDESVTVIPKVTQYYPDGSILCWEESEYDSKENLMREGKYYTGVDKSLSSENVYEYEYDDDGNRIKEIMYRSDGGIEHYYEYDSAGNRTKLVLYRNDGSIFEWEEYEYVTITPQ